MQQTSVKRVQDQTWLGGEGDPVRIMQEIKIWPHKQMVHEQTRIPPGEWDEKISGILRYKRITKSRPEDQT